MSSNAVVEELAITAELCGADRLTQAGAMAMLRELETEREDDLLAGLRLMRREHKGRFTCADILGFSSQAKVERMGKIKRCLWCPVAAKDGSDYCPDHTDHMRQIAAGRLRKMPTVSVGTIVAKRERA